MRASRRGGLSRPRATLALALAALLPNLLALPPDVPGSSSPAALAQTPARTDNIRDLEYWLNDYGIREAWNTTRGRGQTIAIIDSGIDSTHPDLRGAVVGGTDFSGSGAPNGQRPVGSVNGSEHGTLVASLAAGRGTGTSNGVIGSAPEASLLSISIGFDGDGSTGTGESSDAQVAQAVRWAVDNGATVINLSLTRNTPDWPRSWDEAFLYAQQKDVVVVAAAGNRASGTEAVGAPATMPGVLAVAGVDRQGRASRSASSQGITLGVAAPSEQLVGDLPGGQFATWSGTSGAAPIVAGIVALVRAARPDLDVANVINRLTATARDAGTPGPDFSYGFGLVDAAAAVGADVPRVTANPAGDLAQWIATYRPGTGSAGAAGGATGTPLADRAARGSAYWNPVGTLLPPPDGLLLTVFPAVLLFGGLTAGIAFGVRAVRAFGRRRRAR
ncbi:MAG: S8 family serine peptidase [Micrococcales bacterium]|nr:S8 family serine peptidase [Micrococcales bacterium]